MSRYVAVWKYQKEGNLLKDTKVCHGDLRTFLLEESGLRAE